MYLVAIDARGLAQAGKAALKKGVCVYPRQLLPWLPAPAVILQIRGWGWAALSACRILLPKCAGGPGTLLFPWGVPPWDGSSSCPAQFLLSWGWSNTHPASHTSVPPGKGGWGCWLELCSPAWALSCLSQCWQSVGKGLSHGTKPLELISAGSSMQNPGTEGLGDPWDDSLHLGLVWFCRLWPGFHQLLEPRGQRCPDLYPQGVCSASTPRGINLP